MIQQLQNLWRSLTVQPPKQLYYATLTFLPGFISFGVQDKGSGFQKIWDLHFIIFNSWCPKQIKMYPLKQNNFFFLIKKLQRI